MIMTNTTCSELLSPLPAATPAALNTPPATRHHFTRVRPDDAPSRPKRVHGVVPPEAKPDRSPARRQLFFRCTRIVITGAVLAGTAVYARHTFTSAISERAYINAEMTVLRSPIAGRLTVEPSQPGAAITHGAKVFHVKNSRFGNQEAMAQLNWLRELTERLQGEVEEAAVRTRQQEQVYRLHEKLYEEKLISRLAFLEEETKLALTRAAHTTKQAQTRQAESRQKELERQVELQKDASVEMPFDGVAWAIPAKTGSEVAVHEPVAQVIDPRRVWVDAFFHEKHAAKLRVGAPVIVRSLDGPEIWRGKIESVRAGVGQIAYENFSAGSPGDFSRRRLSVRVAMEGENPYEASQFFGVGRSVVVTHQEP